MTIENEKTGKSTVVLALNGRLDTANAPLLERKIKQWGQDITELVLDFSDLTYISSMGLRVLLQAKKELKQEGRKLIIKNMGESIKEVFEMTGFLNLMVHDEKFVIVRKIEADAVVLLLHGQMQPENVETVTKELVEIRETHISQKGPLTVIIDLEKLTHIAPGVGKLLKEAFEETNWPNRELSLRNANADTEAALEQEGVGYLQEGH